MIFGTQTCVHLDGRYCTAKNESAVDGKSEPFAGYLSMPLVQRSKFCADLGCFPAGEKGKQNCVRPEEVVGGQRSGASHLDLFGSRSTLACKDTACGWMARVEWVTGRGSWCNFVCCKCVL